MRLVTARESTGRDLQVAVGAFVVGGVLLALGSYVEIPALLPGAPGWAFFAPLAALCVALGLRRVASLTALGIGLVALAGDVALGGTLANILVFTQVLYEACVHGPPWLWRWALRIAVSFTAIAAVVGIAATGSWRGAALATPFALVFVLSVVSAISVRQYRDQAATERARAEQTSRLSELDRLRAVTAERTRMAREVHDLIANHLSAVAIHATALLSIPDLGDTAARESLQVIRTSSVQGLAEMREMVNLLRSVDAIPDLRSPDPRSPDPRSPNPRSPVRPVRLQDCDRLIARARDAGLAVSVTVAGPVMPLPADVDLAAYRILQESLTNALKHGGGRAEVTIDYDEATVDLRVRNPVALAPTPVPGSGSGLTGMRERAELLGGQFSAGHDAGSWQVRARLPVAR